MFCPNIGVLSASVLSLIPLMRPFAWQSLLLPVLPVQDKMLDLLEAPVPFILGIKVSTAWAPSSAYTHAFRLLIFVCSLIACAGLFMLPAEMRRLIAGVSMLCKTHWL